MCGSLYIDVEADNGGEFSYVDALARSAICSLPPVRTKDNLKKAAEEHMQLLKCIPGRIVKYFSDPAISYAANLNMIAGSVTNQMGEGFLLPPFLEVVV